MKKYKEINNCPGCGQQIKRGKTGTWDEMELGEEGSIPSWDCYCKECDWTGDISPDEILPDSLTTELREYATHLSSTGREILNKAANHIEQLERLWQDDIGLLAEEQKRVTKLRAALNFYAQSGTLGDRARSVLKEVDD